MKGVKVDHETIIPVTKKNRLTRVKKKSMKSNISEGGTKCRSTHINIDVYMVDVEQT